MDNFDELVLKWQAIIKMMSGYTGICHVCSSPVTYKDSVQVVEIENAPEYFRVYFIDTLECPHCQSRIGIAKIYKSLDVTKELEVVNKNE